jgi:hypothetical protein
MDEVALTAPESCQRRGLHQFGRLGYQTWPVFERLSSKTRFPWRFSKTSWARLLSFRRRGSVANGCSAGATKYKPSAWEARVTNVLIASVASCHGQRSVSKSPCYGNIKAFPRLPYCSFPPTPR